MELKKIIYSSYNVVGYLDFCCLLLVDFWIAAILTGV